MILPADTISRSPRIAQRVFEERMLVITVDDSKLHRFNEVGTYIWQQLETPKTLREIVDLVAEHFDGCNRTTLNKELARFLEKLASKKLITITGVQQ